MNKSNIYNNCLPNNELGTMQQGSVHISGTDYTQMKTTFFIADLHLSDDTPDLNALFCQFLREQKSSADALYILGDLFDVWTGDDTPSPTATQVAQSLREFAHPVYFIAGNRDFLLGKQYANQSNMTILPENVLIKIHNKTLLLTHGDTMCTDDVAYLRYRKIIRCPMVQKILLSLPFKKRQQIAANLRAKSQQKKLSPQAYAISDVTETGVQAVLNRFPDTETIIHGHTHRPDIHTHFFKQREIMRYVLPDWHSGSGGFLALDDNGWRIEKIVLQ